MVAATSSMIGNFNLDNIKILQELGVDVYVATNFTCPGSITIRESNVLRKKLESNGVKCYQIDFKRKTGSFKSNLRVIKQLRNIIKNENITGLHVQSPLGGVLGRIAARGFKVKVLYTAHGFQFFPGGPKKDWLLFYPVERFLSHWCDAIITINTDDYKVAKKFYSPVYYIPGVGTDVMSMQKLSLEERKEIRDKTRKKYDITDKDYLILSVGELTKRKNHQLVIRAIKKLNDPHLKYIVAGVGVEKANLKKLINSLNLQRQVNLIGYVNNLRNLYLAADLNVFVSKREGLGFGGLDGVAYGLYIIGNDNTGMKDYIPNNKVGLMIHDPDNVNELAKMIDLAKNKHLQIKSKKDISFLQKYDQHNINKKMKKIYSKLLFNK